MKKIIISTCIILGILSCKKDESTTNNNNSSSGSTKDYAILSMNVNGAPFTSNKANALYSPTNNAFMFSNQQETNKHTISVVSYLGYNINTDYSINIKTISAGSISQAMFMRNGNAFDMFNFPLRSEKGFLNYRLINKYTESGGDKFDVNFNGVIYASETDSVVISNGTIRY